MTSEIETSAVPLSIMVSMGSVGRKRVKKEYVKACPCSTKNGETWQQPVYSPVAVTPFPELGLLAHISLVSGHQNHPLQGSGYIMKEEQEKLLTP